VAIRKTKRANPRRFEQIEVVLFDVGGTLVYSELGHLDLLHQALVVIGYKVTRDKVLAANDLARRAVARRRRRHAARMNTGAASRMWLDHLAEALDLDLRGDDLQRELTLGICEIETRSAEILDPDAHELLSVLRDRGFRLGVISNWGTDLPAYLTSFGLVEYFDTIIASEAVGSSKPHREIFLRGLTALDCRPDQAVHVGDDYWADVVGAREIGIHPVLIDRDREDVHADCATITSLGELAELLPGQASSRMDNSAKRRRP